MNEICLKNSYRIQSCHFGANQIILQFQYILKRLAKSEEENIASSYFKQFSRNDLVNKYKADRNRAIGRFFILRLFFCINAYVRTRYVEAMVYLCLFGWERGKSITTWQWMCVWEDLSGTFSFWIGGLVFNFGSYSP